MKKKTAALCMAVLLLAGCAARPDAAAGIAEAPQSTVEAGTEAARAVSTLDVAALAKQEEAESDSEVEAQNESCETDRSPAAPKPEAEQSTATRPTTEGLSAQIAGEPSEADSTQTETPASNPQASPAPVQPEPQLNPAPAPDPQPQPPARPAFDAGTVIGMACSQIGGMTRVNGAEQGMGSFTHSFSAGETQESIAAGLAAVMAQERDLYGDTYYDIVYCGESGGYHTFRCYRA